LHLANGGQTTVNVLRNSDWAGGFTTESFHGGKLTITGDKNSTFHNDVSSASFAADVTVPMDVLGRGTFEVSSGARLEFMGSVSKHQSVTVSTDVNFGGGKLVIDQPHRFHGDVTLSLSANELPAQPGSVRPEVDLQGILHADSYAYDVQRDLLSIYHGNRILDQLTLIDQSDLGFMVEQKAAGIAIVADLSPKEAYVTPDALRQHSTHNPCGW
jgi:hypothetical protein